MLESINWRSFRFDEIFIIKGGFYNKRPKFSDCGDIPFIGATNMNNGITGFCTLEDIDYSSKMGHGKNHELKFKIFPGNCITVTNNGSVGHAYYQIKDFTCSHDINVLYLKDYQLNKYTAMFLIPLIEQQAVCFAYSRKWRPMRMKSSNIILPVTNKGTVDYEFMENYIKNKYLQRKDKLIDFIIFKLNNLKFMKLPELIDVEWRSFFIESLGELKSGKDIGKKDRVEGNIPYVSATYENNGIMDFVNNLNDSLDKNIISINRTGSSVGWAFYHNYNSLFSNNCRKFKLNHFNDDKYISLFIVNQIKAQKDKYNYGYIMGTNRIKRQKILLPVKDNAIDYDYMRQYMVNKEITALTKYLNYIQNKQKIKGDGY